MIIRTAEIKPLEEEYQANGNRLVIYYGDENCQKEQLLKIFYAGQKAFLLQSTSGIRAAAAKNDGDADRRAV